MATPAPASVWSSPTRRWSSSSPAGSAPGLPSHVEDADLISYGLMGLIGSIERFEPERGIKFETFAMTRIRGAIIDELRSLDWVPRSVRSRAREIENAQAKLEHELQRAPSEAELAAELGNLRGRTADLAAGDRQLLGLRARRALDGLGLLRRPGLAARHDLRPACRRSAGVAGQQRDQGPADRGDRLAARARAARRRPLLLREPHPARDRRGARGDRVARLPAAHQGSDAAEVRPAGRLIRSGRFEPARGWVYLRWRGSQGRRPDSQCRPDRAPGLRQDEPARGDAVRGRRDQPARARWPTARPSPTTSPTSRSGRCRSTPRSPASSTAGARST